MSNSTIMDSSTSSSKNYCLRFVFVGDLYGNLFGRALPDERTRKGEGIINTINSRFAPTSSATSDKYILKGGLPRIQTRIKEVLKHTKYDELSILTGGSMISGSVESYFSQGQILTKALAQLGDSDHRIQYHAPGKYDFVYGQRVFEHTFGSDQDLQMESDHFNESDDYHQPSWLNHPEEISSYPGESLTLNLYRNNMNILSLPVLFGYEIKEYESGVKVGFIGLTTDQKPVELGNMTGISGREGDYLFHGHTNRPEIGQKTIDYQLVHVIKTLKKEYGCRAIILISDFGFAGNVRLAEIEELSDTPIDIIFSSGSGEKVQYQTPNNKTLVIESGFYGEVMGVAKIEWSNKRKIVRGKNIDIGPYTSEDPVMKNYLYDLIDSYYPPDHYLRYPTMTTNGTNYEQRSIITNDLFPTKAMHSEFSRLLEFKCSHGLSGNNYLTHPYYPAAVERLSWNVLAECFRRQGKCQIGFIRGYYHSLSVESEGNILNGSGQGFGDGWGDGLLTTSDLYHSFIKKSYLGRGGMIGRRLYYLVQNMIFSECHGNIYNKKGNHLMAFAGCRIECVPSNLDDLIQGKLRGPSEVEIASFRILQSFDADPFNENNYHEIDFDGYYTVAGEYDHDYPDKINYVSLDFAPQSSSLKTPILMDPSYRRWSNVSCIDIDGNKILSQDACSYVLNQCDHHFLDFMAHQNIFSGFDDIRYKYKDVKEDTIHWTKI